METYQIASDPTISVMGNPGLLHITATGDSAPLCGYSEADLSDWSATMSEDDLARILIAPPLAVCGRCGDEFWSLCDA